ncbi:MULTISPECIES: ABC-2 family transporter protein [unclassified Frankia]|uniref:ABC transporter permease n=1 Tax=unclassified Frankia TaxID=2632575 RepID=UPI001EF57B6E|nr:MULTISPECIES: ABC-2 family transporter protein [unclassified Frankia]
MRPTTVGYRASIRLWTTVVAGSARRYTAYRSTVAAAVFATVVTGILRAHIAQAVWRETPNLAGYDTTGAITFMIVGQGVGVCVAVFGGVIDLPYRIRTGDVVVDIARPVGFVRWWFGHEIGRVWVYLLTRAMPAVAVCAAVFRLRLPSTASRWAAFALSLTLAVLVSFGLRYLVALSAFWLADDRGVQAVAALASLFFSGSVLPLTIIPGVFGALARITPFAATVQVPMDVYLGRVAGAGLGTAFAFQAGWAVLLLAAGRALTALALRRVVIQGG